jgi:saccharopine dehydrogenase-like NADP-dependent oxidoreductase
MKTHLTKKTVLVLGGTGDMGRHAARAVAAANVFERIIIAGLDDANARAFVASLGVQAEFQPVDVTDAQALMQCLRQADVVINAVGPFFRFGELIVDAFIASGGPRFYVDICDDVEPTRAVIARDAKARGAGVTLLVGMGLSPGLSNLLARSAIAAMDEVSSVDTLWDLSATLTVDDGFTSADESVNEPRAAIVHWMHACSGDIRILEDGHWHKARPVERVDLHFRTQAGMERLVGWIVAHPETETLPLAYPQLKSSRNLMMGRDSIFTLMRSIRNRIDDNTISIDDAAAEVVATLGGATNGISLAEEAELRRRRPSSFPYLAAIARGIKDGVESTAYARLNRVPPGGMGANTGVPAALVAIMIANGFVLESGVFTPEQVIDPEAIWTMFAKFYPPDASDTPLVQIDVLPD